MFLKDATMKHACEVFPVEEVKVVYQKLRNERVAHIESEIRRLEIMLEKAKQNRDKYENS